MKIKIWGARGSTPAPTKAETIREKIISALLGIANLNGKQREEFIASVLKPPPATASTSEEEFQAYQKNRLHAINNYLNKLSPLVAGTAGGNTPCVEIQSDNEIFIIDAGSGIRELGEMLMKGPCGKGEGVIHLLFSHPHWDHIQGFPFFRPAFIPGNKLFIYGVHDMETALRRQQEFISFPISLDYMQATKTFIRLTPNDVLEFGDLRIRNNRNHHPGDAYSYRFEKGNKAFVYASDSSYPEGMDLRPYLTFFAEADVLIFDAQFTQRESDEKEDWGHSSSFVGVEMAQQAKVKNLVLFHSDPTYSDRDLEKILKDTLKFQQNQYPTALPINIMIGQEGQTFDLTTPQTTQVQQVPGSKAAILKPAGIFDEHVATKMREHLTTMVNDGWPSQLVIDMSDVEMLQVAGLRGLVKLRKEHQGTPIALAGPSINVQQLIELAGYLDFFAIYPSVHTALNALKARETLNLPGQILKERYKIESKIGEGRLGTVFKATDIQQKSPVAIKILSPSFSEAAIEQFLQQARQIVNLHHPNIVNVYDCDEDRGISFMAEEVIENQTLRDVIDEFKGKPVPFKACMDIAQGIIQALEYAHNHSVVHGDLKPKNVLLSDNGVKISDFGLGRLEGGKALITIDVPLAFVTARYLAPEQIQGQSIDARTDLYAFGVILYELFTGSPIFKGSDQEIAEYHRSQFPRLPRELNPKISRPLEHLILKLLDKDPTKRCQSARRVRHILNSMTVAVSRNNLSLTHPTKQTSTLVGRTKIFGQLINLWKETRNGNGQVVLLYGETGSGKTRLLQELSCHLDDATLLMGNSRQFKRGPAYLAFSSALQDYFDNTPAETALHNVGQVWQQIATFIPEIAHLNTDIKISDTDSANFPAIPDSLAQLIAKVTAEHPWLLILDDLHWADPNSLNLLEYLAGHTSHTSLMIVGTFENLEPGQNPIFSNWTKRVSQQPNCTTLPLTPLNEEETQRLLENIWLQAVPSNLSRAIFNRAQGNPFFAENIAGGLMDDGVVNWKDKKWHFRPVIEAGLPQNIDDAILRRIRRLSRETRTLLNQAAVLGPIFSFDDLYELSDLSEWDALESVSIALERQLLRNAPGEQLLRFSHPAIQQMLYKYLGSLKQRLLHREAGEAIERRYAANSGKNVALLAYNFTQAGELEKGLRYSIRAAKQAKRIFAGQQAIYWYTQALNIADQVDPNNITQGQRFEILLALEQLRHIQGERKAQRMDLTSLQETAQTQNDPVKHAIVHNRRSAYELATSNPTEAETEAQAALIAARQANNFLLECEILIQLATLALYRGQFNTAREHLYAAHQNQNMGETNRRHVEAQRLNGLGLLYKLLSNYTESKQYFAQSVEISRNIGERYGQAVYLSNLGDVLRETGNYNAALQNQQQAMTIAKITGNQYGEALCLNRLGAVHNTLGNFDTARNYAEQAKTIHRKIDNEQGVALDLRLLAAIHLNSHDFVMSRDYAGQSLEIFQHTKNISQQGKSWLILAMALEGLAHISKAIHAYNQAQDLAATIGHKSGIPDAKAGLARCYLAQDKLADAEQEIKLSLEMLSPPNAIWNAFYPIKFYLTALQLFQATGNLANAETMLKQGHTLLQKRVGSIDTPHLQTTFQENVPANKALLSKITP